MPQVRLFGQRNLVTRAVSMTALLLSMPPMACAASHGRARLFKVIIPGYSVEALALSPDGRTIASGGPGVRRVSLWSLQTGKLKRRSPDLGAPILAVSYMPDGHGLAIKAGKYVRLWNPVTGRFSWSYDDEASNDTFSCIVCSPHGRLLAVADRRDTVSLLDLRTGRLEFKLKGRLAKDAISDVAFSPDGQWLAGGSAYDIYEDSASGEALLWNLRTRKLTRSFREPHHGVDIVGFSPDGRTLAVAIGDADDAESARCAVLLWNWRTGQLKGTLRRGEGDHNLSAIAFSPDGRTLAVGSGVGVYDENPANPAFLRLWDLPTRKLRRTLRGQHSVVGALAFSRDGKWLVSGDLNHEDSAIGVYRMW